MLNCIKVLGFYQECSSLDVAKGRAAYSEGENLATCRVTKPTRRALMVERLRTHEDSVHLQEVISGDYLVSQRTRRRRGDEEGDRSEIDIAQVLPA